jgi:hypothetical protein
MSEWKVKRVTEERHKKEKKPENDAVTSTKP